MKKLVFSLSAVFVLAACGNSGDSKSGSDTSVSPTSPAVENVNGNIPDSTNSVPLNRPLPVDSISTDSVRSGITGGKDSTRRR